MYFWIQNSFVLWQLLTQIAYFISWFKNVLWFEKVMVWKPLIFSLCQFLWYELASMKGRNPPGCVERNVTLLMHYFYLIQTLYFKCVLNKIECVPFDV